LPPSAGARGKYSVVSQGQRDAVDSRRCKHQRTRWVKSRSRVNKAASKTSLPETAANLSHDLQA
ncbi:hypothetical protein PHLCEN_2v4792, partial [Hermanssonia centrifuga]